MIQTKEKYNFCTIFDSAYFAKGLALYNSLKQVCDFHLYIFSPDEKCIEKINKKNLPDVYVINFNKVENMELLSVKAERNAGEYYWTIKASCIEYLFNEFNIDLATYVDADTFFYSNPEQIFRELENKSVLIVPHNFSPQYKREIKNGIYNAGLISFKNDRNGRYALNWWKERCIEWCFMKKEDGKFGDQMYLNALSKFDGVRVLEHRGVLANWNVQQYKFKRADGLIIGMTEKSEEFEVILYHFHYAKFFTSGEVELGRKYLSEDVFNIFYKPYISHLLKIAPFELQGAVKKPLNWKTPILYLKRKIQGAYNIFPLSTFN